MEGNLYTILSVIIAGFGLTLYFINSRLNKTPKSDPVLAQWLASIQTALDNTNRVLGDSLRGNTTNITQVLQENTRQMNTRLDSAAQIINSVQKNLGEMSEVGRGIKSLQEFLQSPRIRGGLGEEVLRNMISENFPKNSFHLQYSFKSGVKVDAVLKTDAGLLCIDSKFPMENFTAQVNGETEALRRSAKKAFISDVKKHISDISKKYILPDEGTLDFALMYIPSESVYYEVANISELSAFARSQRVYPVSPNTLYAHLQVLLVSFQGKELEARSKEVFRLLRAIQKDYSKVEENLGVLNRHITNTFNQMNHLNSSFGLLGQKIIQTNLLPESDKPDLTLPESVV